MSLPYSIYTLTTGLITSTLTAGDEAEALENLRPGEAIIEGSYSPGLFFVKENEARLLPPRPSAHHQWDGEAWIDPRTPEDLEAELEAQRAASIANVNRVTGAWRAARATAIWGQDTLYHLKEAAGRALLAGEPLTPLQQLTLEQEVGITASTLGEVAAVYVGQGDLLRQALIEFEGLRIPVIYQIETAPDTEGVKAAETWFLENLP